MLGVALDRFPFDNFKGETYPVPKVLQIVTTFKDRASWFRKLRSLRGESNAPTNDILDHVSERREIVWVLLAGLNDTWDGLRPQR